MKFQFLKTMITLFLILLSCNNKKEYVENENIKTEKGTKNDFFFKDGDTLIIDKLNDENVLKFIYGNFDIDKKASTWKSKTIFKNFVNNPNGTFLTSIINSEEFNKSNVTKKVFITKTTSLEEDMNPIIGSIEFVKIDKEKWRLSYKDFFYQSNSISGIPIVEINFIGQHKYAIFLNDVLINEGIISKSFLLFTEFRGSIKKILEIEKFSENNAGVCDEELNNCYNYKTIFNVVDSQKEIYDIRFTTNGTIYNNGKLDSIKTFKEYFFEVNSKSYKISK